MKVIKSKLFYIVFLFCGALSVFIGLFRVSFDDIAAQQVASSVKLMADKNTISSGESVVLSWNITVDGKCYAGSNPTNDQWKTDQSTQETGLGVITEKSGSKTIDNLTATTRFFITCYPKTGDNYLEDGVQVAVQFCLGNCQSRPAVAVSTIPSTISVPTGTTPVTNVPPQESNNPINQLLDVITQIFTQLTNLIKQLFGGSNTPISEPTPTPIVEPTSTASKPSLTSTPTTSKKGDIEEIQSLLNKDAWVRVIVMLEGNEFTVPEFHDDVKKKSEVQKIQNAVLVTLTNNDFQVSHQYQFVPSFVGKVSKSGMEKLLKDSRVMSISIDRLSAP